MKLGMLLRQFIKKFSTEARPRVKVKIISEGGLPDSREYVDFTVNDERLSAIFSNTETDLVILSTEIVPEIPRDAASLSALLTIGASLGSCRVSAREGSIHLDYCRKTRYFDYSEFVLGVDEMMTALDKLRNGLLTAHGLDSLDTLEEIGDASRLCMPRTRISSLLQKSVRTSYPEPVRGLFVRLITCDDPWEASIRLVELNTVVIKLLFFAAIRACEAMTTEPLLVEKGISSYSTREWHGILEILIDRHGSKLAAGFQPLAEVLVDGSGRPRNTVRDSVTHLCDFEELIFSTFRGEADEAKLRETFTAALGKIEDLLGALGPLLRDSEMVWDEARGFLLKSGKTLVTLRPFVARIPGSEGPSMFHGRARGSMQALFVSHPGLEMREVPAPPALEPLLTDHSHNLSVFPGGAPGPGGHSGLTRGIDANVLAMALKESRWINLVSPDEFAARETMLSVARKWGSRVVVPLPWSGVWEVMATLAGRESILHGPDLPGREFPDCLPDLVSSLAESLEDSHAETPGPGSNRNMASPKVPEQCRILMVHWIEGCPGLTDYLERFVSSAPARVSLVTSSQSPLPGKSNLQCPVPEPGDLARALTSCRRGVPVTREFFETIMGRTRKEGIPFFTTLLGEVMSGQIQANSPADIPRDSTVLVKSLLKKTPVARKSGMQWLPVCLASACRGAISAEEVETVSGKRIQDLRSLLPDTLDPLFSTGTRTFLYPESPGFAAGLAAGLADEVEGLKKEIYELLETRTSDFGEVSKILARAGESPGLSRVTRHLLSSERWLRGVDFQDLKFHSEAGVRFSLSSPETVSHFLSTRWAAIQGCELFFRLELDRLVPDDRIASFVSRNARLLSDRRVAALAAARAVRRIEATDHGGASPMKPIPEELVRTAAEAIERISLEAQNPDPITVECIREVASAEFCLAMIRGAGSRIEPAAARSALSRIAGSLGALAAGDEAAAIAGISTKSKQGDDDWDIAFASAIEEFPPAAAAALGRYLTGAPGWSVSPGEAPARLRQIPPGPVTASALSAAMAPEDPALAAEIADTIPEGHFRDLVNTRVTTLCRGALSLARKGVRKAIDHLNRVELKKSLWDIGSRIFAVSDTLVKIAAHASGAQRKTILNHAFQLLEGHVKYEGSAVERLNFIERLASMVDPMMEADMARGEEIYSKALELIDFTVSSGRMARLCMDLALMARRRGLPGAERLVAKASAMMKTMKLSDEAGMLADMAQFSLGDALALASGASETVQSAAIEKIVSSLDPMKYQDICNSIVSAAEAQQSPSRRLRWLVAAMKASARVSMKLGEALVPHLVSTARQVRGETLKSGLEEILEAPGKFSIFVFIDLIRAFEGIPGPGESATALARAYELNRLDRARVCDLACEMFIRAMDRETREGGDGTAELERAFSVVNPRERFLAISKCLARSGGPARMKALQQLGMLSTMLAADPATGRDTEVVEALASGAGSIPEPHCRKTLVRSLAVMGRAGSISDPRALGILMREGIDGGWLSRHPAWRIRDAKSPGSEESAVEVLCLAELSPEDFEILAPRLISRESKARLLLSLRQESFEKVLAALLARPETQTDQMILDILKGARSISAHAEEPDLGGIASWRDGRLMVGALSCLLGFAVSIGYAGASKLVAVSLSLCRRRAAREDHRKMLCRMLRFLSEKGDGEVVMPIIGHIMDEAGGLGGWEEELHTTGVMGHPWNQQAEAFMRSAVMAALTQTSD